MVKKLSESDLTWREGVPIAPGFDDVYYSVDDGLAETNFVFLDGIGAPEVWADKNHFVIAETGFGTGLNFLATYKRWIETDQTGRLTFISVERFPLSESVMKQAHSNFPSLEGFASKLRSAWPAPSPGFHHRFFENGKIQLILMFGEAADCYSKLNAQIDAWFLDGFAPAKNPDMWSEALFDQIARLSKPGAPFATFTAAGFVKRALAARGFDVKKTKGFGRKRERLVGSMDADHSPALAKTKTAWAQLGAPRNSRTIAVVGAGIAGRSVAAALKRRGQQVRVLSASDKAGSHVPAAILAPGFQAGTQPTTEFITSAFCHACSFNGYWDAWAPNRGVNVRLKDKKEATHQIRVAETLGWGTDWSQVMDGSLHYPKSGSLDTALALDAVYPDEAIEKVAAIDLTPFKDGWTIGGEFFETVVVAAGPATAELVPGGDALGMTATDGQVELVPSRPELPAGSQSGTGYITAATKTGQHTLGSTFHKKQLPFLTPAKTTASATEEILEKMHTEFDLTFDETCDFIAWAGTRGATQDYTPLVGPVPDWEAASDLFAPLAKNKNANVNAVMPYQTGLYVLAGFGSKGYQQAPYAAECLAAQIVGDPIPISQDVAAYLHPARFLIRRIIRGQA